MNLKKKINLTYWIFDKFDIFKFLDFEIIDSSYLIGKNKYLTLSDL